MNEVVATTCRAESADLLAENWRVHRVVTGGVPVERAPRMGRRATTWPGLVDFDDPDRNDFVGAC